MIRNLQRTLAHVWHVAVGTRDAGFAVRPLIPDFELWMLRFEDFGTGFCVLPVIEAMPILEFVVVVEGLDVFDL